MSHHTNPVFSYLKDSNFIKNNLKRIILVGCFGIIILAAIIFWAGSYLLSQTLGYLINNSPAIGQFVFSILPGYVTGFFQDYIIGLLSPLVDNTNVDELKKIIVDYFEKLKAGSEFSYERINTLITTVKEYAADGKLTADELAAVKKLLAQ